MWRACRVAALRQLRLPVDRMPLAPQPSVNVRFYYDSIAGVGRDVLLKSSARDLRAKIGESKIGMVVKALKSELNDAMAREDVTSKEITDLFMVAQKTRATSVMLNAFDFLEANYPSQIGFAVYGEIFRIFQRKNLPERLIEIYKTAKPRFEAVPEMIYRFGIVGYLQADDLDSAVETWQEMTNAGHETTNEIASRFMLAYARKGDVGKVQELYNSVDPQIGHWHESCIDRVILSMGIIERPEKAFEFYSNSSMKLSGGTLIALLSVCKSNNCKQQAMDILANRKKFDLHLDARGYNRIMGTLEFLERNDEIKDVLEEMVEKNVRFDTMTKHIIERNAEFLKNTNFIADPNKSKAGGFTLSPRIRELLAQENKMDAAALVDSIVEPVIKSNEFDVEVPEGAMIVRPSVSRDAVRAYIQTNQHEKVAALVKGFSVVPGKYGHALAEVITHYMKQKDQMGDDISYAASKAMLFHDIPIYRVDDTLKLFHCYHDPDAALKLFDQVLASYKIKKGIDRDQAKPFFLHFNIGKVINSVLRTLAENGRVTDALETLNKIESCGLEATEANYVTILRFMHKHLQNSISGGKNQRAMYDISSVQVVLKDLKRRDLKINKTVVGFLCPAYVEANKQQRLELLEAFAEAKTNVDDTYVLPPFCYETLLRFMAQEGNITDLKDLYEEALVSLSGNENRGVPRSWVTVLISKLVKDGNIEEAEQLTIQMPEKCGGYTYGAIASVLRGAFRARNCDIIDGMIALIEEQKFIVKLSDSYELVHLAQEMKLSQKVLEIISLFEKGNFKEVTPSDDGNGILEAVYARHARGDVYALRKVKTMYTVALKMCERDGLWKQALVLRNRMIELLGQEAVSELAANPNDTPTKRKVKQSYCEE